MSASRIVARWEALGPWARAAVLALVFFAANQAIEGAALVHAGKSYRSLPAWDAGWYARMVRDGYEPASRVESHDGARLALHPKNDAANWAFFPLFPMLASIPRAALGIGPAASVVLSGKIFFLLSIAAFIALCRRYAPGVHPALAAAVASLNPCALYGNVGYTEPLFLLLTCLFFILLKRNDHVGAGLAGALLTATRFVGIAAIASYLVVAVRDRGRREDRSAVLLGFLLIPLGLALFMLFLHARMGDALSFLHVQVAWERVLRPLPSIIADGLRGPWTNKYWAILSVGALAGPLYFVRKRQLELAVYSWLCTLAPLATSLVAMPRFIWWQAPILLLCAILISKRGIWIAALPASVAALFYSYLAWLEASNLVL